MALDAGDFGSWLDLFTAALHDGAPVDVPCEGCTACCRSGKRIAVDADEGDALAHIPAQSLEPMPGQPGRFVLRHDESGRCSQLTDDGCAVYEHRPHACRMYDCRIFAAAGVRPDKPLIVEQVRRWRFRYDAPDSRQRHQDVRSAAVVLGFPGGLSAPISPTQHAVAAIEGAEQIGG